MAINKITAGLASAPSVFAQPVLNQLQALAIACGQRKRASGGYILKGSLFNIGGSMYVADADTAITGTKSSYIKITASGKTATAEYVSSVSGVSWDGAFQGCYDTNKNLYITEEQFGIRPPYEVLSGSGTYTVPPDVFTLHVKMYGPGGHGSSGGTSTGGNGGASGAITEMDLNVEPMKTYAYTITSSGTTFGDNSARTNTNLLGQTSYGNYGGNGGGFGGGSGGASQHNGHDATGTYGGGGGGGGVHSTSTTTSGGSGALGRIELS